jgi:hypothetical protein
MMPQGQPQEGQPQEQAPEGQPPEGQPPSIEQMVEQIRELPPGEALLALEQVLKDDPKAQEIIQKAKEIDPEKQKEVVDMMLDSIEGSANE